MFRDIVYINYDYTLRIQDGYLIFRWWRSYVPKDVSEGNNAFVCKMYELINILPAFYIFKCESN